LVRTVLEASEFTGKTYWSLIDHCTPRWLIAAQVIMSIDQFQREHGVFLIGENGIGLATVRKATLFRYPPEDSDLWHEHEHFH